ncbi:hypothetical protein BDR07DRAFT_1438064, partial [Suillus spraguei]
MMYGSQGLQRRPGGAPMYPNQQGIIQERQSQINDTHQFGQPHPGPSPLNLPKRNLPRHDEYFSGPQLPNPAMVNLYTHRAPEILSYTKVSLNAGSSLRTALYHQVNSTG